MSIEACSPLSLQADRTSSIAAVPGVDVLLIGCGDLTSESVRFSGAKKSTDPASMGIPGEYDSPRIEEAFDRVSEAAKKVSVEGRLLSVGFGGLQYVVLLSQSLYIQSDKDSGRLDLVEKFARKNSNARFVMAGADNTFLLPAVVKGGSTAEEICQRLQRV